MIPQRIGAKLFLENTDNLDLSLFIPVFHRWIRNKTVEGLLVDVADYKHVPDGPGVILIGHEGDYAIDLEDGRPGLRYIRKLGWHNGDSAEAEILQERLNEVLRLLQQGADALAKERKLRRVVAFRPGELQVTFYDQLRTPNTAETFEAVRGVIENSLASAYPDLHPVLELSSEDERRPFSVTIHDRTILEAQSAAVASA